MSNNELAEAMLNMVRACEATVDEKLASLSDAEKNEPATDDQREELLKVFSGAGAEFLTNEDCLQIAKILARRSFLVVTEKLKGETK